MPTIANEDPLQTPVQFVRGVGPARAELLARLNLLTVSDLLWNIPRDVLDLTRIVPVFDLKPDVLQTVSMMNMLMGKGEASQRRTWLEEKGNEVEADI